MEQYLRSSGRSVHWSPLHAFHSPQLTDLSRDMPFTCSQLGTERDTTLMSHAAPATHIVSMPMLRDIAARTCLPRCLQFTHFKYGKRRHFTAVHVVYIQWLTDYKKWLILSLVCAVMWILRFRLCNLLLWLYPFYVSKNTLYL